MGYLTPDAYCGYLAWNGPPRWETAKFEVDGTSCLAVTDTMVEEDSYHAKETSTRITALPYATDPAYRDVTLVYGDQKCRLRLPVTRDHGPSVRQPQTLRAGPYTITFRPEPWRLTTAPFVVGVSADAPPGVRLLLTVSWQMLPGNFQTVIEGGWLLEGSKTTYVSLPRDFGGIRTVGKVLELDTQKAKLDRYDIPDLSKLIDETANAKLDVGSLIGWEADGKMWLGRDSFVAPNDRSPSPIRLHRIVIKRAWPYGFSPERPKPAERQVSAEFDLAGTAFGDYPQLRKEITVDPRTGERSVLY